MRLAGNATGLRFGADRLSPGGQVRRPERRERVCGCAAKASTGYGRVMTLSFDTGVQVVGAVAGVVATYYAYRQFRLSHASQQRQSGSGTDRQCCSPSRATTTRS